MKIAFASLGTTGWRGTQTPENKRRTHMSGGRTFQSVLLGLQKELEAVKATDVRLGTFHKTQDLRQDGFPKAGARPSRPGVELHFTSGSLGRTLLFLTDLYREWVDNLRDIVMTLESLRSLAGRGAAEACRERLYQAFSVPPREKTNASAGQAGGTGGTGGRASSGTTTARATPSDARKKVLLHAAATLLKAAGVEAHIVNQARVLSEPEYRGSVVRAALIKGHPDHGGDTDTYRTALDARDVLKGMSN